MDKALKQRLVGATVLIILTVIVLPMLLSGRSDTLQQGSREIEIPQKPEEISISKRRFPVGVPDQPTPDIAIEQDAASELIDEQTLVDQPGLGLDGESQQDSVPDNTLTEVSQSEDPQSEESKLEDGAIVESSETIPEKAPVVTKVVILPDPNKVDLTPIEDNQSSQTPRYLVQVASFSSEKRADALATQLHGAGMQVEVDVVERNAGRLHRVRVGPYAARGDADAAVAKIKLGRKSLSPRVMDLRPDDSAPVSTPSDPLVRWVVQVGSFSSPESAESQVAQLRLAGLPAFAEKVTSGSGSVYKVRVGPEVNRDKASELARKIKNEQNLDGFVTTQE